jgi:uncharacterized protein involved in tellurium resistance
MSEVRLKPKVTLKRKGDTALFTFNAKLQIEMIWSSETDLDLCLFWKTNDGKIGGVFSDGYNQNTEDLGHFDKYPFIELQGDKKTPRPGGEKNEVIKVKSIDALSELYVVVLNYDKAIDNLPVTFSQDSGRVEITTDTGDSLEVLVDSPESGHVYLICKIENKIGIKKAINERRVLTLGQAFNEIPGFALICNS